MATAPDVTRVPTPVASRGVYVHWPFCVSKCPYCDFNSHIRETVDQQRWQDALVREVATWAAMSGGKVGGNVDGNGQAAGRPVDTVFFGGGTPSLMPPETTAAVLQAINDHFGLAADAEITLEANPSSVEAARFRDFRAAGVNRVSLGVQSFDDQALRFLGRAHDASEARRAIDTAAATFDRFSFDLIYALPDQTADDWRAALTAALQIAGDHLSLYQLTIEPNTGFAGQVRRGVFRPLDDDPAADLFDLTQDICADAGMPAYEISNHARDGAACRHNIVYWQYGDWIGVGPGAHGRPVTTDGSRRATANLRKPEAWLEAVEDTGTGLEENRVLAPAEQAEEALMMGLRLTGGIDTRRFATRTGLRFRDVVDEQAMDDLIDQGVLDVTPDRVQVTAAGRLLLNGITGRLLRS